MKFKLIENKIRLDEKQWVPVEIQHPFKSYSFKTRFYVPNNSTADEQIKYVADIVNKLAKSRSREAKSMKFANELLDYLRSGNNADEKATQDIFYNIQLLDSDADLDLRSAVIEDRTLRKEARSIARNALIASGISTDAFFVHHKNGNESDQYVENLYIGDLSELPISAADKRTLINAFHNIMHLLGTGKANSASIPVYKIVDEDGENWVEDAYEITCSIRPL